MIALTPLDPWIACKVGDLDSRLERAGLEHYQLTRLNATLQFVREHSPFYRQHLAAAPESLASLADLAGLPFTTAEDLRENPLRFVCVSQDAIERVVTLESSGTTGAPKRVFFTREDQELTLDFFQVGMSTFTDPGDRVFILLPAARPGSVGDLLATALQRHGAQGIRHGPIANLPATIDAIVSSGATVLVGTPTQALALARHPAGARLRLKSVLLSTDYVPPAIVAAVEHAWHCRVYNHYGMTELGLGGGVECQARHGYHWREADLLIEIVDPSSGKQVADGEYGEIIATTLTRNGMPLIRYRTGDPSRILPDVCPCRTALKTLERIRGRSGTSVTLGQSTLSMADLDDALFPIEGLVNFSATLTRGPQDRLEIDVLTAPGIRPVLAATIDHALTHVVALNQARQDGRLALSVSIAPHDPVRIPQLAKRTIAVVPPSDVWRNYSALG